MWSYLHYTSLPAREEEYSQTRCSDSDRLEPSSATATAGEYCSTDKLTAAYIDSLFGTTSAPLERTTRQPETISTGCGKSVTDSVSAEDSLVKTYQRRGEKQELQAHAPGCGKNMPELLARLDRLTCTWRIVPALLDAGLTLLVQTYPRWGIVLSGALYPLEKPALPISVSGFGGWRYPTACVCGIRGGSGAIAWIKSMNHLTQEEKRRLVSGNGKDVNPDWVEWLMGWQIGWTRLQPGDFGTRKSTDYPDSQSSATTGDNG